MSRTVVYVDGSCENNGHKNPVAGIGVYFGPNDKRNVGKIIPEIKTNNQAELLAAITALESFKPSSLIEIRSDSKYVIQGMNEWRHKWKKYNWFRNKSQTYPVLNKDMWIRIDRLDALHDVKWVWVKGHTGELDGNYYADMLATKTIN